MNLNRLLPKILDGAPEDKIRDFLKLSLTPRCIVDELRRTKRFEVLPLFLGMLQLAHNKFGRNSFEDMAGLALAEDDKKSFDELKTHLKCFLCADNVAYYYGIHFQNNNVPDWIDKRFYENKNYVAGLVAADNLTAFTQASFVSQLNEREQECLCWTAGHYHSQKMIEHFGFTPLTVKQYLDGAASSVHGKLTVEFIASSIGGWKLGVYYKENLHKYGTGQDSTVFFAYLKEKGYLHFSEEEESAFPLDWVHMLK